MDHVKRIIDHVKSNNNDDSINIKYLCLVGGMSESIYFKSIIQKEFGNNSKYNLSIITPTNPILSVV